MPLYEYQCRQCGHRLEARQRFADAPLTECPNCGNPQGLFRVVQAAGIVFKGSGFYVNDSRGNRESITGTAKKKDGDASSESDKSAAASSSESSSSAPSGANSGANSASSSASSSTESAPKSSEKTPRAASAD